MLTTIAQHKLKFLGIVFAAPLSLFLTLIAVLDLPPVQAGHHTATLPFMPGDPFATQPVQPSRADPSAPTDGGAVSIVDFAFSPAVITVTAGTVVTWTNLGSYAHTTTSDVGSLDPWDSGSLSTNGTFTRTFNTPGTYGYHCTIHPTMQGTVVVLSLIHISEPTRH